MLPCGSPSTQELGYSEFLFYSLKMAFAVLFNYYISNPDLFWRLPSSPPSTLLLLLLTECEVAALPPFSNGKAQLGKFMGEKQILELLPGVRGFD